MPRLPIVVLALLAAFAASLAPAVAASYETDTNRPGGDYTSFQMRRPVAQACSDTCKADSKCYSWTYVKPGIQGRYARCWLKGTIPNAVKDGCCISGTTRLLQFPGKTKVPQL